MKKTKNLILGVILFYILESIIITPLPLRKFFNLTHYYTYKGQAINFSNKDRVLIISPHPDDAVLSCSGVIQDARKVGAQVKIVYITYGSHNETAIIKENKLKLLTPLGAIKLGERRYNEVLKATNILGLRREDIMFLGFPDFGTLKMWTDYFAHKSYFSGLTLHNRVFYRTADGFGLPFQGKEELSALENIIQSFYPTKIFYPSLLDLNSDHRATGLFIKAALSDLEGEIHPSLYEYLVHSQGWPLPYGYFPDYSFSLPNFINNFDLKNVYTVSLNRDEENLKREAIEDYKSQVDSNKNFMYSFVKTNELFFPPHIYKMDQFLPLWRAGELQKIKIVPYIKSISLSEDSRYVYYNINFYSGIPLYTKINLFIYEKNKGETFKNSPRYRFIIGKSLLNKPYYKIISDSRFISFKADDFKADIETNRLIIRVSKKYFSRANFFLSSLEIEKGDIRVAETPWWEIALGQRPGLKNERPGLN